MLICHLCSSIESKLSLCIQMAHGGMNGTADAQKVTIIMYSVIMQLHWPLVQTEKSAS